ncbi:MAG: glycosyltransferase family 2 protein [Pseudarcicella sp.]|nr:glycosyltransferase family 2 protein [Pseudarcicella sp.]
MTDKVSIIIPCYNQAKYLPKTLESVLNQTYINWECIMIDDGSLDDTAKIAKEWTEKDSRFMYFKQDNQGLSSTRNNGLDRASGEWIQFLDSDDIIHPDKLSKSISAKVDVCISNFRMFKEEVNNKVSSHCKLKKEMFNLESLLKDWDKTFTIPIHCALFKSTLIDKTRFNVNLKAKEDWLFWIDIFLKNPSVEYVDEKYAYYRLHDKSMTSDSQKMLGNLPIVYSLIYERLESKVHIEIIYKRAIDELKSANERLFDLIGASDVHKELLSYKKYKEKYYNTWYRKLFYTFKKKK